MNHMDADACQAIADECKVTLKRALCNHVNYTASEFWKEYEGSEVSLSHYPKRDWGKSDSFTLEEMYRAFKARMLYEMRTGYEPR